VEIRDFLITVRFEKETDKRKEEWGYKPVTINLALSALRGLLATSWKMGLMTTDDSTKAKSVESVKSSTELAGRDISPEEIEALMKVCGDDKSIAGARDAAIIAILTMCELLRLMCANSPAGA
jgi:site-specific recombinase XerD